MRTPFPRLLSLFLLHGPLENLFCVPVDPHFPEQGQPFGTHHPTVLPEVTTLPYHMYHLHQETVWYLSISTYPVVVAKKWWITAWENVDGEQDWIMVELPRCSLFLYTTMPWPEWLRDIPQLLCRTESCAKHWMSLILRSSHLSLIYPGHVSLAHLPVSRRMLISGCNWPLSWIYIMGWC